MTFFDLTFYVLLSCGFLGSLSAQVPPNRMISNKELYKSALSNEREHSKHILDENGLIAWFKNHPKRVILDLRSENAFKKERVKGAIHIPLENLTESKMKDLSPSFETPILIYCENAFYPTRMISMTSYAYPTLVTFGYKNVYEIGPLWRQTMKISEKFAPFLEKN